jgi:Zn-dependent alcohol dehydrogenases
LKTAAPEIQNARHVLRAVRPAAGIRTLPDPTPETHGLVLKVEASGICRSDWHGWMGHDPDIALPHVPGHEFAGRVVAVGRDVRRFRIGDRVTMPFVAGCGRCPECGSGNQQVCRNQTQPGFTHWGSFAEYVGVHNADDNVVALPDEIDFPTAASLGCRFATSFRAVVDQGRVRGGEWVAVHGCGGVGLSAIMIAAAMGANVIAVDIADDKLEFAKTIGAAAVINGRTTPDVAGAIRDLTSGGAHLSIDALGHRVTARNSILGLKRRGRHVQVGLMLGDDAEAPDSDGPRHRLGARGLRQSWHAGLALRRHAGHDRRRQACAAKAGQPPCRS